MEEGLLLLLLVAVEGRLGGLGGLCWQEGGGSPSGTIGGRHALLRVPAPCQQVVVGQAAIAGRVGVGVVVVVVVGTMRLHLIG